MSLLLKFEIHFDEQFQFPLYPRYGVSFHRWLPDGERDAITLETNDPNTELRVWFNRMGTFNGGMIEYSRYEQEVDPAIMVEQGRLEGGPLVGRLTINHISEDELLAVVEDKVGEDAYIRIGKRVVKRLIYPPVARFISLLRLRYGQYWISPLRAWDARVESLSKYCSLPLRLQWSANNGESWRPFSPDALSVTFTPSRPTQGFTQFLTESDWNHIVSTVNSYEPSLSESLIARAHELASEGNIRYALIEGVTAVEVAVQRIIGIRIGKNKDLATALQAFYGLALKSQITAIGVITQIAHEDLELAIQAIDLRNKVVHEASDLPSSTRTALYGLLRTGAALMSSAPFKFPPGDLSVNMRQSAEGWLRDDPLTTTHGDI